jgi:hypothetical protein
LLTGSASLLNFGITKLASNFRSGNKKFPFVNLTVTHEMWEVKQGQRRGATGASCHSHKSGFYFYFIITYRLLRAMDMTGNRHARAPQRKRQGNCQRPRRQNHSLLYFGNTK